MVRGWVATLGGFASKAVSAGPDARRGAARTSRVPDMSHSVYARGGVEPPIDDVLDDPIIQLVMRSDRLERSDLRALASSARR
jgi:hypothetical protein